MRRLYWLSILVICSTALSTILAGCFGGASERLQSLARGGGRVVWARRFGAAEWAAAAFRLASGLEVREVGSGEQN